MQPTIGILLFLLAALTLAASFVTPTFLDGRSAWTEDQSLRYREVNQQLHQLAFSVPNEENKQRLKQAQAEQNTLKAQLQNAQQRGGRAAWWLRGLAAALLALGVFSQRQASQPDA